MWGRSEETKCGLVGVVQDFGIFSLQGFKRHAGNAHEGTPGSACGAH